MRVLVTTEAACDLEMGLSHMAHAALRNGFPNCGRMPYMAAGTSHAFVLSARYSYVSRRTGMTLHTVFICQRGLFPGMRRD